MSNNSEDKDDEYPPDEELAAEDKTRIVPAENGRLRPNDSNKTRVMPTVASSEDSGDVTTFSGRVTKESASATVGNKARAYRPTENKHSLEDKATIVRGSDRYSSAAEDATRLAPGARPGAMTAEPKPIVRSSDLIDSGDTGPEQADVTEHGILKNRFVLEEVLGVGGMGVVYKAKDLLKVEARDRDPYVAIKVLSEEFKTHPEAFITLQRESRKTQRIAHPNIVNVHDFDRDENTVFMTMEFLDGSPLDKIIRQYKSTGLPTDYAWDIIKEMSSALSYAHAEKVIHSDFKPGNVFVTTKGTAKVFDFGIARAVAQVEHLSESSDDKTLFDAGNLGALTPAYASLEMLEGKKPDVRDDIYALGCVAYELFTGEHPYSKVPADEAERQGLKPKRISNIKKSQWRAIEKAIAFRRENRTPTVDQFLEGIAPSRTRATLVATGLALLLAVLIVGYFFLIQESELEREITINFHKEDLDSLIENPSFTARWQNEVWDIVTELTDLTKGEDPWIDDRKIVIYKLYLEEINSVISQQKYDTAIKLITNARRYSDDTHELDVRSGEVAAAIERMEAEKKQQAENTRKTKKTVQTEDELAAKRKKQQESKRRFDAALANVREQLKCRSHINMRDFEIAIKKLRELDRMRYSGIENDIVNSLADCITHMAKSFPERARDARKQSLRIFRSSAVLVGIEIAAKDPCDKSLAGLGARGKRAVCRDKIDNLGSGPDLVVIPASGKMRAFAIGKYEVSVNEVNKFCKATSKCPELKSHDGRLPASAINFKVVKRYLKWLSKQTGQKYRLPTKAEWVYAAKSRSQSLDANRNCKLSARGIKRGEALVRVSIGKQNKWGLVNYVGNVQEWVYDQGRKLVAVGGSFEQPMESCSIATVRQHSGSADKITGFRVLRELSVES